MVMPASTLSWLPVKSGHQCERLVRRRSVAELQVVRLPARAFRLSLLTNPASILGLRIRPKSDVSSETTER